MAEVSGTVLDSSGQPCAHLVRLHRLSDGRVAGEAISNAATGAYSITALDTTPHYAVRFFRAALPGDPNWANVGLLLPFNDPVGSTSFTEQKNGFTPYYKVGGLTIGSGAYGTALAVTSAGVQYLTFFNNVFSRNNNYSVEMFIYPTAYPDDAWVWRNSNLLYFGIRGGKLAMYGAITYGNSTYSVSTGDVPLNTWSHIALVTGTTDTRLFLNGQLVLSVNVVLKTTTEFVIGNSDALRFTGAIKGVRFTAAARYTDNFAPPPYPYPTAYTAGDGAENAQVLDNLTPA